jgi:hypothetical protein
VALIFAPALVTDINVLLDTSRDPTSHNLWPFEILAMAAIGLVPGAGLFLGWLVRKLIPVPAWLGWIPAALAVIFALWIAGVLMARARRTSIAPQATAKGTFLLCAVDRFLRCGMEGACDIIPSPGASMELSEPKAGRERTS